MKRTGFGRPTPEQIQRNRDWQRGKGPGAGTRKGLSRKRRISPVPTTPRGRARKQERFRRAYHSREYMDLIHAAPCVVKGCRKGPIEAAHVGKTRKNGGQWFEVVPLCPDHHREQEGRTERFDRKYRLDLMAIAHRLAFEHMGFTAGAE